MLFRSTYYYIAAPAHQAGPQLTFAADGWRASMTVFVPNARPTVIDQAKVDFLGYSEVKRNGTLRYVSRTIPHNLPFYNRRGGTHAGQPALWCNSFAVQENYTLFGNEFVGANGLPKYRWAKVTLGYTSYRFALRSDTDPLVLGMAGTYSGTPDEARMSRYVIEIPKPSVRTITAPQGAFYVVPGSNEGSAVPSAFGVPISEPMLEYSVRWIDAPEIPMQAIERTMGAVNSTTFLGRAPETLLCMAPEVTPTVQSTGSTAYTIDFRMVYNPKVARTTTNGATAGVTPRGWNWFLRRVRPTNGVQPFIDYRLLTANGQSTGTKAMRSADFTALFRLDQ